MDIEDRLNRAANEYAQRFKVELPVPFGVSDEGMLEAIEEALTKGRPIPDDYDFWAGIPKDADA